MWPLTTICTILTDRSRLLNLHVDWDCACQRETTIWANSPAWEVDHKPNNYFGMRLIWTLDVGFDCTGRSWLCSSSCWLVLSILLHPDQCTSFDAWSLTRWRHGCIEESAWHDIVASASSEVRTPLRCHGDSSINLISKMCSRRSREQSTREQRQNIYMSRNRDKWNISEKCGSKRTSTLRNWSLQCVYQNDGKRMLNSTSFWSTHGRLQFLKVEVRLGSYFSEMYHVKWLSMVRKTTRQV